MSLLSFSRPSVQTELDRFSKALSETPESFDTVSKSAFTQSRKKLKPEAFIELAKAQLQYFLDHAPNKKDWRGSRVVAIDGSLLNLPHTPEIRRDFGFVTNQHEEIVSARTSFAYDISNELVLDASIAPRKSCEKELAVGHLDALDPLTDILVFDRGYPCQWLMGLLIKRGFRFCFRLSTTWKHAYSHMEDGGRDKAWRMERASHRELGKLRTYDLPRNTEGLRLLSIELKDGEQELLVTNMADTSQYSLEDFEVLYNLRWGVEEAYKTFKKVLHIEHFTGKSSLSIKQDFYAKVFMMNMASMVRSQGGSPKKRGGKKRYQINKTQSLAKLKDFLVHIFYKSGLRGLIRQMLKILQKRIEMIRPGRTFPRKPSSARRRQKIINLKGI